VFKNLENLLVDMENFHSRKANSQGNTNIKEIIRNSNNSKEKDTSSVQKTSGQDLSQVDGKSAPRRVHIQVNRVNFYYTSSTGQTSAKIGGIYSFAYEHGMNSILERLDLVIFLFVKA
jgi:hypothetical protein